MSDIAVVGLKFSIASRRVCGRSANPESAIADTSWMRAGLSSWDWWSGSIGPDGKSAFTKDTIKYYVDFAVKFGFPYMLIDAGYPRSGA